MVKTISCYDGVAIIMNFKGHFIVYAISWFILNLGLAYYRLNNIYFVAATFVSFIMVNPDIDLIFGAKGHRNFFTHSGLFPLAIYRALHPYWNPELAKEIGVILFLPVLIHLLADFKITDNLIGTGLISMYPLMRKRLTKGQTRLYITCNCILIILFIWLTLSGVIN